MVLIVSQTLIHLGPGEAGKASGDDAVHGFAALEQADQVVNTDAGSLDDRLPAAYVRLAGDVPVGDGGLGRANCLAILLPIGTALAEATGAAPSSAAVPAETRTGKKDGKVNPAANPVREARVRRAAQASAFAQRVQSGLCSLQACLPGI